MLAGNTNSLPVADASSPNQCCFFFEIESRKKYILTILWFTMLPPTVYIMKEYILSCHSSGLDTTSRSNETYSRCSDICVPVVTLFSDNLVMSMALLILLITNVLALVGVYMQNRKLFVPFIGTVISLLVANIVYLILRIIYSIILSCDCQLIYIILLTGFFSATYTFAAYETFKTKTGFTPEITSGTLESPADLSTPEEMREVVEMGEMIEMVEMVNVPLAPPEPSIVTSEVL